VLVGENFHKVAKDKTKDVIVEFCEFDLDVVISYAVVSHDKSFWTWKASPRKLL